MDLTLIEVAVLLEMVKNSEGYNDGSRIETNLVVKLEACLREVALTWN